MNSWEKQNESEKLEDILTILSKEWEPFAGNRALLNLHQLLTNSQYIEQLLPIMFGALSNPNSSYYMALALGRMGDRTLSRLIKATEDKNANVRSGACLALGQNYSSQRDLAIPVLLASLSDKNSTVRQEAINSLSNFHLDSSTVPTLILTMQNDPEISIRFIAAHILERIKDSRILEPALEALEDKESMMRCAAIRILGSSGNKQVLNKLIEFVENENEDSIVRLTAVNAVSLLGGNEIKEFLINLLTNKNNDVRYGAVQELAKIGDVEALPYLEEIYLNDEGSPTRGGTSQPTIKKAAAEAIQAIKDRKKSQFV